MAIWEVKTEIPVQTGARMDQEGRMKNIYRDEVEILIWTSAAGIGVFHHPGHAALELRSDRLPNKRRCISWWPGEESLNSMPMPLPLRLRNAMPHSNRYEAKRAELGRVARQALDLTPDEIARGLPVHQGGQPRAGQKLLNKAGFENMGQYGQSAQVKIRLPLVGTRNKDSTLAYSFGLYGKGISRWWDTFRNSQEGYRFISATNNCSGTVMAAMVAGGAGAFSEKPSRTTDISTPDLAREWSQSTEQRLRDLNAKFGYCLATLNASNDPEIIHARNNVADELLVIGIYLSRAGFGESPGMRMVEAALRAYHQTPWGAPVTSEVFSTKIALMADIVSGVYLQFQGETTINKDKSAHNAMLVLCSQIAGKLDALGDPPYFAIGDEPFQ